MIYLFYAIIDYQFKTRELKNGAANSSGLKVLLLMDWECAFLYSLWNCICVGGPWKSNLVLEKSLKMVALFCMNPAILKDPGTVSQAGRKGTMKVFKHRWKNPWVLTLTRPFPTIKQMLAPDWAQKTLCIIVPNRRTASPEFFLEFVHDGYCLTLLVWFVNQGCEWKGNFHFQLS